jgi:hypothetical protein
MIKKKIKLPILIWSKKNNKKLLLKLLFLIVFYYFFWFILYFSAKIFVINFYEKFIELNKSSFYNFFFKNFDKKIELISFFIYFYAFSYVYPVFISFLIYFLILKNNKTSIETLIIINKFFFSLFFQSIVIIIFYLFLPIYYPISEIEIYKAVVDKNTFTYWTFQFMQKTGATPVNVLPSSHVAPFFLFLFFHWEIFKLTKKTKQNYILNLIFFIINFIFSFFFLFSIIFAKKHYIIDGLSAIIISFIIKYLFNKFTYIKKD